MRHLRVIVAGHVIFMRVLFMRVAVMVMVMAVIGLVIADLSFK